METYYHKKGIIVEGVECAGKSTLIQKLRSEIVPWDCKMLGHKPGIQFDRFISEYVINDEVVFNRSHISEVVYSELWQRETPFSSEEYRVLNDYIKRHFILILCEAETSALIERYQARDYHQKVSADELDKVKELFIAKCANLNVVRYDGSKKENLLAIIPIIQNLLKGE